MNRHKFNSYKADLHARALRTQNDELEYVVNDALTFIKVDKSFPDSLPKKKVGVAVKNGTTLWLLTAKLNRAYYRDFDCQYTLMEFLLQLPDVLTLDSILHYQFKQSNYDGLPF